MRRFPALVLFAALPLLAQLPPGTARVTFSGEMRDAFFLAATSDGTLWAASIQGPQLERIGIGAQSLTLPERWNTRSMAAGPDGALWVGDDAFIARVDPATNAVQRWPQGTYTDTILSGPDGNLWIVQGRSLARMRTDGSILWKFDVGPTTSGGAFGTDGALYLAGINELVRVTAAAERTTFPASPQYSLWAGPGFLWNGEQGSPKDIRKLSYRGETLATYHTGMSPFASDALGNLWLRATTAEGEIVGQLTPQGVLTRFAPLPLIPSNDCFPRWYGGMVVLSDGRVAMSDFYPILPRLAILPNPCWDARKPEEFRNTVTYLDPRVAPVMSVEVLNPVRRRTVRR